MSGSILSLRNLFCCCERLASVLEERKTSQPGRRAT